jgi:hypothetical protein
VIGCAKHWETGARLLGNLRACDISRALEALSASSGSEERPTAVTVHRSGSLIYTLMHDSWRKGVEQFRNRLMVRVDRDKSVPDAEYEAVMARLTMALEASSETQEEPTATPLVEALDLVRSFDMRPRDLDCLLPHERQALRVLLEAINPR